MHLEVIIIKIFIDHMHENFSYAQACGRTQQSTRSGQSLCELTLGVKAVSHEMANNKGQHFHEELNGVIIIVTLHYFVKLIIYV